MPSPAPARRIARLDEHVLDWHALIGSASPDGLLALLDENIGSDVSV